VVKGCPDLLPDPLHPGGLGKYSPETPEGGSRGVEKTYGNEQNLQELADDLNVWGYRKAANTIERLLQAPMSYTAFPKEHWRRIRTMNMMKRSTEN